MKLTQVIALIFMVLSVSGCDLTGEPTASWKALEGQVLEQGTNKPIGDAIVTARWLGTVGGLADSTSVCFHVESTKTDSDGRYHIPAWKKVTKFARSKDQFAAVDAFKPGYRRVRESEGTVYLERFEGTREERFAYLSRTAVSCSDKRKIEVNLLPLYKALYEEARTLAVTKEEKLKALYRLRDVERLELGSDQAWENFRQRQRELQ